MYTCISPLLAPLYPVKLVRLADGGGGGGTPVRDNINILSFMHVYIYVYMYICIYLFARPASSRRCSRPSTRSSSCGWPKAVLG